jgi:hypothetical protein
VTDAATLQAALNRSGHLLAHVEEGARSLHKEVDVGIDVAEIARLGKQLDAKVGDWVRASAFLDEDPIGRAFATCNGVAFSLAGHAKAAVGFSAMANRGSWKSRWDNVWSEWRRALAWRDQALETRGLHLAHRVASDAEG